MQCHFYPGQRVQHFKRTLLTDAELAAEPNRYLYEIVGTATHSETRELYMVYQALYDEGELFIRPLEMFCSPVDREKYPQVSQAYRFQPISQS